MGVAVLALFRESQYYGHSRNLNPSKFMPYTVAIRCETCAHTCVLVLIFLMYMSFL